MHTAVASAHATITRLMYWLMHILCSRFLQVLPCSCNEMLLASLWSYSKNMQAKASQPEVKHCICCT